jgi:hypothetical protein
MTEVTSLEYGSGFIKVMQAFSLSQRLNSHYNMGPRHRNQYLNPNIKRLERLYGFVDRPQSSTAEIRKPEFQKLNRTVNARLRPRSARAAQSCDKNLLNTFQPIYMAKRTSQQEIVPNVNKSKKRRPVSASYGRKSLNIVIPGADNIEGLCIDTTKSCISRTNQLKFEEFTTPNNEEIEISRITEDACPLFGLNLGNDMEHILGKCECNKCVCGYHPCPANTPATSSQFTFMTDVKQDYTRRSPSKSKISSRRSDTFSPGLFIPEPKVHQNLVTPSNIRPKVQYIKISYDSNIRVDTDHSEKEAPVLLKPAYKDDLTQTMPIDFSHGLDLNHPIDSWLSRAILREPSYVTGPAKYVSKYQRRPKEQPKPRVGKKSSNASISITGKANPVSHRKTISDARFAL